MATGDQEPGAGLVYYLLRGRISSRSVLVAVAVIEGVLLAVMIAACAVLVLRQQHLYDVTSSQAQVTACQDREITRLATALQVRAALGDETRRALIALDAVVAAAPPGSPAMKAANTRYAAVVNAVNTGLNAHPVPGPVRC
jgi:hypothetical protein